MPYPKPGDPRRPLYLAISHCRIFGFFALLAVVPLAGGFFVRGSRVGLNAVGITMTLLVYALIGAGYLTFAYFIARRSRWAITAAFILTAIISLMVFCIFAMLIWTGMNDSRVDRIFGLIATIEFAVLLALLRLLWLLGRSFAAMHYQAFDAQRGFEILTADNEPRPVEMLPEGEGH